MKLDFLSLEFASNQLYDYLIAAVILCSSIVLIKVLRRSTFKSLRRWAAKTENIYEIGRAHV